MILLGAGNIGKSALSSRFCDKDLFVKVYHETIVDIHSQLMLMLDNKGAKYRKVNLKIKDVGHKWIKDNMYDD